MTMTKPSSMSQRIAARVQERDSWSTSHTHSPREVFNFLFKYKASMPRLPSQQELNSSFPVLSMDWKQLVENNKTPDSLQVTWIGHATCLVQIGGYNILTDPIFSKRCAPTQWAGPARYRPPPCSVSELVEHLNIDVVVISHNHYDHLDYQSILELSQKSQKPLVFAVPLGIGTWLRSNISKIQDRHTIVELDWHETYSLLESATTNTKLDVTAVPMQHWSSRRGWDRDATLWCGFRLRTTSNNVTKAALFSGDTGWFEGLYDIGEQYGPFDLAMIPIGAYEPREFMKFQHTDPRDAVKMMQAVQARRAVPIHWGTFQLTKEHYMEPREKLAKAVKEAGLSPESFGSWLIGATIDLKF